VPVVPGMPVFIDDILPLVPACGGLAGRRRVSSVASIQMNMQKFSSAVQHGCPVMGDIMLPKNCRYQR